MAWANIAGPLPCAQASPGYAGGRCPACSLTRAEQEISLPVACLLLLVRSASQLFKLHTHRSLYNGLQRLQERFSSLPGEGPRLPQECHLCHLADGLFCSHEISSPAAYSSLVAAVISL